MQESGLRASFHHDPGSLQSAIARVARCWLVSVAGKVSGARTIAVVFTMATRCVAVTYIFLALYQPDLEAWFPQNSPMRETVRGRKKLRLN